MKPLKHILILDPIPFTGGSKISTLHMLSLLEKNPARVSILTCDVNTWKANTLKANTRKEPPLHITRLLMPKCLQKTEQGLGFFLRHFLIAAQLFWLRLFIGRIDAALGISGPGVDFALYLGKAFLGFQIIQMIHGPVARSRTIGRCLIHAEQVFYLESTKASLCHALHAAGLLGFHDPALDQDLDQDLALSLDAYPQFHVFKNGLSQKSWPSPCQYQYCVVFWAASILKWKGLDTLMGALSSLRPSLRPETHVSYILPKQLNLPISKAPQTLSKIFWHCEPTNFDALRAHANIFVSTSTKEPFGLSILEAMAAGMCIIIPKDGAFWDAQLTEGVHCLKYPPGDEKALAEILTHIQKDMKKIKIMGQAALIIANEYRAELCFQGIWDALLFDGLLLDGLLLDEKESLSHLEQKKIP